jgi:DNA-binding response OmpR family regulator
MREPGLMKTLLFEVDTGFRESLAALLRSRGHDVMACATVAEAKEHASAHPVDLLILD